MDIFQKSFSYLVYGLLHFKDRILWFEADIVKRLYLWHFCWHINIIYTK